MGRGRPRPRASISDTYSADPWPPSPEASFSQRFIARITGDRSRSIAGSYRNHSPIARMSLPKQATSVLLVLAAIIWVRTRGAPGPGEGPPQQRAGAGPGRRTTASG